VGRPRDRAASSRGGAGLTRTLQVDGLVPEPGVVDEALRVLATGGLLVYPTETLYGFGGLALEPGVAERVRAGKQRDDAKPLALVARDLDQARGLAAAWPEVAERLALRFWPGPLALILSAAETVPVSVTAGTGTVAVRVSGLPLARALCARGPLISTSANRSGEPPPATCGEARAILGDAVSLALDAGPRSGAPSTIVDVTGAEPSLARAGAVPWPAVLRALRSGVGSLQTE